MALIKAETAQGFSALPALRQLGLMVGLATSVALGVAVVLWSQEPSYSLLYGSLSDKDSAEVMDALQQVSIPYKVDESTGAVMVPSGQVHQARMKLAGEGLPRGSGVGFELLQNEQELGTSQFVEQARYQRALEVELARSMIQLNNVRNARVHLAIPKRSVFIRDQQMPSASVVLDLYPGRTLQEGQVSSIVHLVAASIPNLTPEKVTVVDQEGTLLTRQFGDRTMALTSSQFEYARRLEETYVRRIEDLIEPIVGPGRVRAQVAADIDFTRSEQTRESYNPEAAALRSEEVVQETNGSGAGAQGVPGALTNQPPEGGSAEPAKAEGESGAAEAAPTSSHRRAVRNYELDKTISHTRSAAGRIERLSVAVLVDDRQTRAANGAMERTPLTEKELEQVTGLVKDAVGFDDERGDTVNVINSAFQEPAAPVPLPDPPLWQRPWLQNLVKQLAGGMAVLLLVFGVLRPVLRSLAERGVQVRAHQRAQQGDERLTLGGPHQQVAGQLTGPGKYEDKLAMAKGMASQDPGRVAQVVKNWVGTDG